LDLLLSISDSLGTKVYPSKGSMLSKLQSHYFELLIFRNVLVFEDFLNCAKPVKKLLRIEFSFEFRNINSKIIRVNIDRRSSSSDRLSCFFLFID